MFGKIQLNRSCTCFFFPPTQVSEIAGSRKATFREETLGRGEIALEDGRKHTTSKRWTGPTQHELCSHTQRELSPSTVQGCKKSHQVPAGSSDASYQCPPCRDNSLCIALLLTQQINPEQPASTKPKCQQCCSRSNSKGTCSDLIQQAPDLPGKGIPRKGYSPLQIIAGPHFVPSPSDSEKHQHFLRINPDHTGYHSGTKLSYLFASSSEAAHQYWFTKPQLGSGRLPLTPTSFG